MDPQFKAANIPLIRLKDGVEMLMIGFGAGTAWYKDDKDGPFDRALVEMVKMAISHGFLHNDTAEMYNNEEECGVALKECGIRRDKLFVTAKVTSPSMGDIPAAIGGSLKKLGLEYVDLYLIHTPWWSDDASSEGFQKAWEAMESVKSSGKARAIGVSNYLRAHLEMTLQNAKVTPAVNQLEFHPYLQRAGGYVDWMQCKGM